MLVGLPMCVSQGLYYYQAHWYDYISGGNWCARCTDYATVKARYNLDAPLVIGEFYAGPDTDALQRFEDFYTKGYAGAWPWSLFWDHTDDQMQIDFAAARAFATRHSDLGPRGQTGATPPPTPTATPTPVPTTAPPPSNTAPSAPTNLRTNASTATSLTVSWTDTSSSERSFEVAYRQGRSSTWTSARVGVNTTTYTLTGLRRNTSYTVRVRACNAVGCSAWSNEVTATTAP